MAGEEDNDFPTSKERRTFRLRQRIGDAVKRFRPVKLAPQSVSKKQPESFTQEPRPPIPVNKGVRVTEEQRTLSKPPAPEALYLSAKPIYELTDLTNTEGAVEQEFTVPDGRRLVIEGIPYCNIQTGEREANRTVQIYHNQEGFLVADKVVEGEIARKGSVVLAPDASRKHVVLGETQSGRRGSTPYNYEKQILPLTNDVQLMSTTYKIPHGDGSYSQMEIVIVTPDDTGDQIQIAFVGEHIGTLSQPITVKQIPDVV